MASPLSEAATHVSVDCPAKINLHLRVGPVRPDGFHPLLTWMTTVGLKDRLELATSQRRPASTADTEVTDAMPSPVSLVCDDPSLPSDERNLVVRILNGWSTHVAGCGGRLPQLAARLAKRTPAGAGLGGGSSDAAGALLAACRMTTGFDPTAEDLSAFAAGFGSDIPFFLHAPSAVCKGRGEIVEPVPPPAARWVVLVLPQIHLPTADVYRRFDAMRLGKQADVDEEPDWSVWRSLSASELMARLVNDLEPPSFALRPELGKLRDHAEAAIQTVVRMSGSGSSLFVLADTEAVGQAMQNRLAPLLGQSGLPAGRVLLADMAPPFAVRVGM